jgi:protein TonB
MGVVAALHVAALFMIARSLGLVPPLVTPDPIVTNIIDEPPPVDDPPPRTEPDLTPTQTFHLPEPEAPPIDDDPPPPVITEPPEGPPQIIGPSSTGPVIVGVRPDPRYPLSQPPYPPRAIREGGTGTADIEVYVLPSGRVGDARVVRSTGFDALDASALEEAKRKWRLIPATRDGVAYAQWHRLRVTFKLNER